MASAFLVHLRCKLSFLCYRGSQIVRITSRTRLFLGLVIYHFLDKEDGMPEEGRLDCEGILPLDLSSLSFSRVVVS
jgi:hypothetical protein